LARVCMCLSVVVHLGCVAVAAAVAGVGSSLLGASARETGRRACVSARQCCDGMGLLHNITLHNCQVLQHQAPSTHHSGSSTCAYMA
jgi:hypothetical protein